jgi:DNA-directed RNA polymerase specialized sigma24 family protein
MGSRILATAVAKAALTQPEAEAVMERAVYERSFTYIGKVLGIPPEEALNLYEQAMPKLRKWAEQAVLVLPSGQIICD